MIVYGNKEEIEDYFADPSINQSYLKQLIKGVEHLEEKEEVLYFKEKGHFVIGGAVDVFVTQGNTNFDEQYHVATDKKPSDTIMSIVRMIFDGEITDGEATTLELNDFGQEILESVAYHKYQPRWKEETILKNIIETGSEYFEELKEAHGKNILSPLEKDITDHILMSWRSSKYTAPYFQDSLEVDIYYQVPIYFDYEGVPCKVLLDIVRVNTLLKTIEPVDLKTLGGFTSTFPYSVKSFGYNFQASFYTEGLKAFIQGRGKCDKLSVITDIEKYTVQSFKFIVETTHTVTNKLTSETRFYTGRPLVYRLSEEQMELGKYGNPEMYVPTHSKASNKAELARPVKPIKYKEILGFTQALDLYKWHLENGFEEDKNIVESGGTITIE